MELALSAAALPGAALAELLDACARRGMRALELVDDGATPPSRLVAEAPSLRHGAAERGAVVVGYRTTSAALALSREGAELSAALGAPVALSGAAVAPDDLAATARLYAGAGGTLLLGHGSDPAEAVRLLGLVERAGGDAVGLCWEVRPAAEAVTDAAAVLAAAGERLRLVRLHGGGPEAVGQTGSGVGDLMMALTLARYRGALVLAPSTPSYHLVWSRWLGRGGGWGCGSRAGDAEPVALAGPGGHRQPSTEVIE